MQHKDIIEHEQWTEAEHPLLSDKRAKLLEEMCTLHYPNEFEQWLVNRNMKPELAKQYISELRRFIDYFDPELEEYFMWDIIELPSLLRTNRRKAMALLSNLGDKINQITLRGNDNDYPMTLIASAWGAYQRFIKGLISNYSPLLGQYEPWDRGESLFLKDEFIIWLVNKIDNERTIKDYANNLEKAISYYEEDSDDLPLFSLINLAEYVHTDRDRALKLLEGVEIEVDLLFHSTTQASMLKSAKTAYKHYKEFITQLIESNSPALGVYEPDLKLEKNFGDFCDMQKTRYGIYLYDDFMQFLKETNPDVSEASRKVYGKWLHTLFTDILPYVEQFKSWKNLGYMPDMLFLQPDIIKNKMLLVQQHLKNAIVYPDTCCYDKETLQGCRTAFKAYTEFINSIVKDRKAWLKMYLYRFWRNEHSKQEEKKLGKCSHC